MAEKGILLTDQAGGISIATRDAYELDGDSNPRVIQRVDMVKGRLPSPMGAAIRVEATAADPTDIPNFPAELTSNLIECGDKSTLVVHAEFASIYNFGSQNVDINPVMYDGEVTPGVIGPMEIQTITEQQTSPTRNTDGTSVMGRLITWDLAGAAKIGIHLKAVNVTTNVSVWAWVI